MNEDRMLELIYQQVQTNPEFASRAMQKCIQSLRDKHTWEQEARVDAEAALVACYQYAERGLKRNEAHKSLVMRALSRCALIFDTPFQERIKKQLKES